MQIPFNAPKNEETKIFIDDGSSLKGDNLENIVIPACDQYQLQCEAMNEAVLGKRKLAYGVEDAIENAKVIAAVFRAAKTRKWEIVE